MGNKKLYFLRIIKIYFMRHEQLDICASVRARDKEQYGPAYHTQGLVRTVYALHESSHFAGQTCVSRERKKYFFSFPRGTIMPLAEANLCLDDK